VCQVGTTVFNAVYESGLQVVARKNHSLYISHYPKGRDATVSWGGPDLKFKNNTDNWVLISVSYTDSSITVALYGTDPGYSVHSEVGEWTNLRPRPIEEIQDPTMPEGSRVVEESGADGRSITVKRTVSKDGKVLYTDTFASKYNAEPQVVRIGIKKPDVVPPAETPAAPTTDN
ncbi:MAG: VanW family protein, partial [Coriobacteriia bacterium]|nr:VanW family protein [Coriobacteriia bacterium]